MENLKTEILKVVDVDNEVVLFESLNIQQKVIYPGYVRALRYTLYIKHMYLCNIVDINDLMVKS